jgi:hypothetical protein
LDLPISNSVSTVAAAHRFVILTWVNLLLDCALAASSEGLTSDVKALIGSQAALIDGLADTDKKSIAHGAVADVRRSIRKVSHACRVPYPGNDGVFFHAHQY